MMVIKYSKIIIFIFLINIIAVAQAISQNAKKPVAKPSPPKLQSGVYQAITDQGIYPASIKVEGNTITYKDFRGSQTYVKGNGPKYINDKSNTVFVLPGGTDKFMMAEENSSFKRDFSLYSPAKATPALGVISFIFNEDTYYAKKSADPTFHGEYLYFDWGKWGAPKVVLNSDGTGSFQRHDVAPTNLNWFIETNPKGNILKTGNADTYRTILVVQYTEDGRGVKKGDYDRIQLDITPEKAIIMGERVKLLK